MGKILISIIMPAYNVEKFIRESINSVIYQTFENWELIIVDDISIDKTLEVAKSFAKKDKRIKVFCLRKKGYRSGALNYGIKKSKGKYIGFLDGDDLYNKDKLSFQYNFLEKHKEVDMIYGKTKIFGEESRESYPLNLEGINLKKLMIERSKFWPEFFKDKHVGIFLGLRGSIPSCSPLIRKQVFKKVKFDKNLKRTQDYDLWFQMIGKGMKLVPINKTFYQYRKHPNQSIKNTSEVDKAKKHILKKFLSNKYFK